MKTLLIIFLFLSSIAYSQDIKQQDSIFLFNGYHMVERSFTKTEWSKQDKLRWSITSDFGDYYRDKILVLRYANDEDIYIYNKSGKGSGQGFRQQDSPIDSLRKSIEGEIKLIQQALTKDNTDNIQFLIGKLEALQVVLFEMKKYGLIK